MELYDKHFRCMEVNPGYSNTNVNQQLQHSVVFPYELINIDICLFVFAKNGKQVKFFDVLSSYIS